MLETLNPTLDYWMQFILPYTGNSYSITNTSGWKYRIDTPDHKIYEKDNIVDYELKIVDEYSPSTSYRYGEYALEVSGSKVYKSLSSNNSGNDLTNTIYWYYYTTLANPAIDTIWQPVFGDIVEKARVLNIEKTNIFNIIQTLAEKFQVQVSFEYEYNDRYETTGRTIVFSQDIVDDELFSINYGINTNRISRNVDTTDLITKMYVEPIDSEFEEATGLLTIQDAPQNLSMENFLYNFNYLRDIGEFSQEQYDAMTELLGKLRLENIEWIKESINYFALDNQRIEIENDLQFIEYQLPAIQQQIDRLTKEVYDYSYMDITVEREWFAVKAEEDGTFSVDISAHKGAFSPSFKIEILAPMEPIPFGTDPMGGMD